MSYPTLEQYNEAFQHPQSALTDPGLRSGSTATTGLGLPLALCGGFALTYTVTTGNTKYAVRCFHKQSKALEQRYRAISTSLKSLNSPYFLNFEFQPQGVRVNGGAFPVVKMAWASGITLGEFLEGRHRNSNEVSLLSASFRSLSKYLEGKSIAHGDIQPGNVMVFNGGRSLQLIDYDGMYVDDLRTVGSSELGHRNFQHPARTTSCWDSRLDRFSFIALNVVLRVLESDPSFWDKTNSDENAFLFKANDFADPARSVIFNDLFGRPQFSELAKNFAAICKAPYAKVPTLEEFLAGKNIPQFVIATAGTATTSNVRYMSAYPVLDANDYAICFRNVGERIELIGKIVEVKQDKTRHGKPYIFINFGPWKGEIVKVSIWSEGFSELKKRPNQSWVGKWISVVGLMEPPYVSRQYNYSHLSISITQSNQLHIINESEAKFRLAGTSTRSVLTAASGNRAILEGLLQPRENSTRSNPIRPFKASAGPKAATPQTKPVSQNKAIIAAMKSSRTSSPQASKPSISGYPKYTTQDSPVDRNKKQDYCFIATAIYGWESPETKVLRSWRDQKLITNFWGRALVSCYYTCSPYLVTTVKKNKRIASLVRATLDWFISRL